MARERAGYEELRLGKLSFIGECPSAPKADFRLERLSFLLKRLIQLHGSSGC